MLVDCLLDFYMKFFNGQYFIMSQSLEKCRSLSAMVAPCLVKHNLERVFMVLMGRGITVLSPLLSPKTIGHQIYLYLVTVL